MSPASTHAARQLAWRRTWDRLLASAAERQAITLTPTLTSDSADDRRPLGADVRPSMHEDRTTRPRNLGAAFEEDSRRVPTSTTD
jgi:hypothetical protein